MKKATKITAEQSQPVPPFGHPAQEKALCTDKKTSDRELVQSRDQLQKIMDQSLDVICTINENGCFVRLGAASKGTWGYLSEELIGTQCMNLVQEEDKEKTRLAFLSIINGSATNHFENRCTKKNGELVFITWSATWDNDDMIMYCVARDTTATKKAEKKIREERMLLRSLMDILPINVYTKDLQERKTLSNRSDYEYTGFTSEAGVLGKNDFDLFDKESAERTHLEDQSVLINGERIIGKEEHHIRKDGSKTWFFISKIPLLNEEKEIMGLMGISYDITERKEIEETIRIAKERYDVVVKATNEAVWDWDILTGRLYWGENYRTLFGFNPELVISLESWSKQVHPDDVERVSKSVINAVRSSEVLQWEEEYRFIKADGSVAHVLDRGFVIRNADGEPSRMIGAMQDITQKINAAEKLIRSEKNLSRSQEISHIGSWEANLITNTSTWSDETYRVLGYKKEETQSSFENYMAAIHPDDIELVNTAIEQCKKDNKDFSFTHRVIKQDGTTAIVYTEGRYVFDKNNDPVSIYGVHHDITAQKLSEEALTKRKMQLSVAADIARLGYWELNFDTGIFTFNDQFYAMLKTTAVEMGGYEMAQEDYASRFLPQSEREKIFNEVTKAIEIGEPGNSCQLEHKIIYATGEIGFLTVRFFIVRDENGRPVKTVGANQDITDRKAAEEQLRLSKERYDLVTQATNDVIYEWDVINDLNYWGEGYQTLFGHKRTGDKMPTDTWVLNLHPEEREELIAIIRGAFEKKKTSLTREIRFKCADGSYKTVFDNLVIVYNEKGQPLKVVGAMQDITERKKNETAIKELNAKLNRRAEELAASNDELEQFAYVASHDLQEPLRMISSFLQLLQKKYDTVLDETATQYIGQAVSGAERMKRLIMDLLEYSRVGTSRDKRTMTDMNAVMKQVMQIFANKMNDTSAIMKVPTLPEMSVNKMQVTQLFQNLVGNAFKYNRADRPAIEIGFEDKKTVWQFYIKDNGIGINPKYFEKVFVIFQRLHTRSEFSGTGIGLAICKKIVERHGGTIWVESAEGKGSTFYFTIKK
jgi:PAS domain S-box-containing protein